MAISTTRERVAIHAADETTADLERKLADRLRHFAGNPHEIEDRLHALDTEWDIGRAIEANAAALAFLGTVLGFLVHPYWLAIAALVTVFLLQHAIQGWCPPVPILRRLGFRTLHEIERERHALKALRGDYRGIRTAHDPPDAALHASGLGR